MGSSKAPPAPDYVGAANAQGAANLEAAKATGRINNPNVNNPYGTQRVTWDGDTPTITQALTPEQQAILSRETQAKTSLGDAGVNIANQVRTSAGNPLDFSKLPGAPQSAGQRRDDVVKAMMSRIDTDTAGQRDAKNSELIAAGIRPGTRAYDSAMTQIDRQYNDARSNAILAGGQEATRDFGMDNQSRQQAIAEMLTQRQTPLNEINAIMSGAQVSNPFASGLGYQGGMNVGAAPIAGAISNQGQAQQNIYNQQQAQQNGNIQAGAGLIGSLGGAYLSRPGQ
ncbi:MAG: hypothetical protein M0R47_16640 [Methylobacter sp.]|uniref:hypothetical protein n=1 Tax=Methylobacter sp. TaxID=2051955 RepID=UPI0025CD4BEA|nr:hypothetical protein [Methylobacter sp.]MCK9622150.1 hypothetical protein [Methylobacter sp.]